jgi:methylated-DNA-protein-cysteine methyltransferase-like protein
LKNPRNRSPEPDNRLNQIWRLVRSVPRGSVATYGDIAEAVRPPCNPRQVGWALGVAPAGLQLPWHRILAAGGRIALPPPNGLEQRLRLASEGVTFSGKRVRLALHRWQPRKRGKAAKPAKARPHDANK